MPFLTVYTNATKINQKNFVEEISDLVAGELHKPVSAERQQIAALCWR